MSVAQQTTTPTGLSLTTLFTPPPSCTDIITRAGTNFWQGGKEQTGDPDCYPPNFYSIYGSYYSPGICPSGWSNGGSHATIAGSIMDALCCPQYAYNPQVSVDLTIE